MRYVLGNNNKFKKTVIMKQMTVREIALAWSKEKKNYVKHSTYSVYSLILERHIIPAFGDLSEVSESCVQRFALGKLDSLSEKGVKDVLMVLKMVMRFGERKGMTLYHEWDVRFPTQKESKGMQVLTVRQQKKLMTYLYNNFSFRNLGILICMHTGLRIGEVCALRWSDIDLVQEVIHVSRTVERVYSIEGEKRTSTLVFGSPKSISSNRDLPISKELMRVLHPLSRLVRRNTYVVSNGDRPTEPRALRYSFYKVLTLVGLPHIRFHGLRHTFATRCIESGCDYKTVSVLLGHSTVNITLNLYVHPGMEQKQRCINQMMSHLKK